MFPNEDGVASFRHDREQAIAVNRLLLGIAAGLTGATQKTVHEVIKKLLKNPILDNVPDQQVDPILAVTLSDVLAIELIEAINNNKSLIRTKVIKSNEIVLL